MSRTPHKSYRIRATLRRRGSLWNRFMVNEIQWQWVRRGTQSGRIDILSHPDYIHATSYNSLFPAAMRRLKGLLASEEA